MQIGNNHLSAIVFDFGGVLFDWNPRHLYRKFFAGDAGAMERFLEEIGFSDWNLQQDAGRPFSEAIAELCRRHPEHCELIRAYDTRWEESLAGPIQATVEILRGLKEAGYPLFALSNWSMEKFMLVRHKYKFLDWFETIVISGDVGLVKPDERIFRLLLRRIGRTAAQCLLVDDSLENIDVARELGFNTIYFRSPGQLESDLRRLGVALPTG